MQLKIALKIFYLIDFLNIVHVLTHYLKCTDLCNMSNMQFGDLYHTSCSLTLYYKETCRMITYHF